MVQFSFICTSLNYFTWTVITTMAVEKAAENTYNNYNQ